MANHTSKGEIVVDSTFTPFSLSSSDPCCVNVTAEERKCHAELLLFLAQKRADEKPLLTIAHESEAISDSRQEQGRTLLRNRRPS
jgi:hypothetical protein